MLKKLLSNGAIAVEAVVANRVRSLLTALGIIFGVAAVIAMLAIGAGAQQEILDQIKLVGVNNIVITPVVEQSEGEVSDDAAAGQASKKKNLSLGLNFQDVRSIQHVIPGIEMVSPEVIIETSVARKAFQRTTKLVGVRNEYFEISGFQLAEGKFFNSEHLELGSPVCVIGKSIAARFFNGEEPLDKYIKVGKHWLRVIGVLEERMISDKSISNLGIRDYNMDVYTPLGTALLRYENRSLVSNAAIQEAMRNGDSNGSTNYHQLDRLVLKVENSEQMGSIAQVLSKMLKRKHSQVVDYEITIPELLLKQQQRTKNIFNYVLGGIAGISLLVGGIGIMNIMLASVLERIKEIGLRLSIGATKTDIIFQFLLESVMISFSGGMIGIILGLSIAFGISELASIPTIVNYSSIVLSFGVAVVVGIIFGIAPAKRAADQDPITSLRYD
ncbi:ABC transporter permease [Roseivirga pacifica]|uniref:ABC transporter permease n=1 Tax=Roseivirga pacifica TaxID=1267423 RepID=UPI0020944F01|nr:ABC transporter permease [Roseivirga pacifica]MCO6358471.1 FtsX-like permease family protein [Roseivirga pacifica]MCO6369026.1 FtsX-like permease family protein [Roseivirga pacifica]MCO6372270.1 FtsX-like permease family protein [Roseivirga pacifica]MCO6374202.1 FtsX-like permease family protein [Roseivirga pacifica]MCO6381001.1 FtsX-like permease family protein [Roseivirga pacifica]